MQKVNLRLSKAPNSSLTDVIDLGETEQSMLERAKRLHERHLKLMEENPEYAELYNSIPDRSDFVSGVPVIENAVIPALVIYNRILREQQNRVRWVRDRKLKYKDTKIKGKSVRRRRA
jgi:hypothetical protein